MTKNKMDKEKIEEGVRLILEGIGEDINREGLLETPDRIARMYKELAAGYTDDSAISSATFASYFSPQISFTRSAPAFKAASTTSPL